jgi:hypothetical protein
MKLQFGLFLFLLISYVICTKFTLPSVSYLAKIKVASRLHDSNYDGWIFVDREKEPAHFRAIITHREDSIVYEYDTGMGQNVFMYMRDEKSSLCRRFNMPMPYPIYEAVSNLDEIMFTEQQEVRIDGVFDSAVRNCISNSTLVTVPMVSNDHVVLCGDISVNGLPSQILGEKFQLDIVDVKTDLKVASNLMDELMISLTKCEVMNNAVVEALTKPPAKRSLKRVATNSVPWFLNYEKSCRLGPLRDNHHCTKLEMRRGVDKAAINPTKTCVFLHGVGQSLSEKGPPLFDKWPDYWGNVHEYTPQCKERIFIREETKMRGWNDLNLQQSYCSVALYGSRKLNYTDTTIRNTVLFVHSMGNLILAGGISNGFCDLDLNSSSWYQIQGPFRGSKAANLLTDVCKMASTGDWPVSKAKLFRYIAEEGGYCVPYTNHSYPGYQTLIPNYCGPNQECIATLHEIANKRIKGSMCGDSAYGLFSRYGPALKILAEVVGYGEDSDGLVPISSCKESSSAFDFKSDYRENFYGGDINHSDGTCRNGDAYFSDSRAPCSYFIDKV